MRPQRLVRETDPLPLLSVSGVALPTKPREQTRAASQNRRRRATVRRGGLHKNHPFALLSSFYLKVGGAEAYPALAPQEEPRAPGAQEGGD